MTPKSYRPFWPETIVFWGAGATKELGMLPTGDLGKALYRLTEKKTEVIERVKLAFALESGSQDEYAELADFIECIEADEAPLALLDKYFESEEQGKKYHKNLHKQYDWEALCRLVEICPGHDASSFKLNDLYNLIDMHWLNKRGINTRKQGRSQYISSERIIRARVTLNMLVVTLQAYQYRVGLKSDDYLKTLEHYQKFADELACLMQEEGLDLQRQGAKLPERRFYLFSYAVISMNWDPLLLWLIFMAHRDINNNNPPYLGNPAMPLKLFNDLGHFMGVREIDSVEPNLWYPLNETVAQRLNDSDHPSRRVRIGKYYFPHGSLNWRECPWCGKLLMHLGDKWESKSESLFPPTLLPGTQRDGRSLEEQEAIAEGRLDAIQCSFCGGISDSTNIPLVMQSSFKGEHAPFVEEIQRDMGVSIEHAKHFVFLGYRLPEDDLIYRSLLAARRYSPGDETDKPYFSVVGFEGCLPKRWIDTDTDEYKQFQEKNPSAQICGTVKQLQEIFENPKIRIYGQGLPSVFFDPMSGNVSRNLVRDLLCPREVFPQGRIERAIRIEFCHKSGGNKEGR